MFSYEEKGIHRAWNDGRWIKKNGLSGKWSAIVYNRAGKSTYRGTIRLDPSWDILNLRANFQRNQKFSYFLRAVTSLFHDIRTGNCMYNHIGYKESCICND